jgi:hypothetical protein
MLKGYYQGLIDGALRVNGIFLVAAGWIVASPTAATFLQTHATARQTVMALVLFAHGLFFLIALRAFALSRSTARLLGDLNYMPPKYYDNHRIRPMTLGMWYLSNLLITGGIVSALVFHE